MEKYSLEDLNSEIIDYRSTEDASLREVAAYINKSLLEQAVAETDDVELDTNTELFGAISKDEALDTIYTALHSDEVPPDQRARVRKQLEQAGIDVDDVTSDWVSHTTVSAHLNSCLDINTSQSEAVTAESAEKTIEWAKTKCKNIISRTVQRLQSADIVTICSPDISLSVHVTCTDCNTTFTPSELLSRGECNCVSGEKPITTGDSESV
jgi:hypothetical protein